MENKKRRKKQKKQAVALLLCMALTTGLLSGCATWDHFVAGLQGEEARAQEAAEEVRIGIFEPITGTDKRGAAEEIRGIELAHQLFPDVLGKPVKLVYGDNQSDMNRAEAAATELVNSRVSVVLGSYTSTLSLLGSDVFAEAEIPVIGITCTNPILTKSCDYYARVCFIDAFQGDAAARYVFESLKESKAIILKEQDNDYAAAMAKQFSQTMVSLLEQSFDGQVEIAETSVVYTVEYAKGTEDFTEQKRAIRMSAGDCKVVFLPSDAQTALAVMEAMADMNLIFVGTDRWEQDAFLQSGSPAIEGARFTTLYDAESDLTTMSAVFLEAYREAYGEDTQPSNAEALGFDAYLLALSAIEEAGDSRNGALIMRKMTGIRELEGATGTITLNADGDPIKPVVIIRMEKGEMVHEYTVEPDWGG